MGAQLTIVVRIKAKAGVEDRVKSELLKLLPPSRAEGGCYNFDLHQAVADPTLFLVHENWRSEADLQAHFEMPYIKEWLQLAPTLLAEPMELTRWHPVR